MRWQTSSLVALSVAVAACSNSTDPLGNHQLQVNVRVVNGAAAAAAANAPSQSPAATTVDVQGATFVFGGVKLETAGVDNTVDWVFEESAVIPLDLTGTPTLAFDTDVTPGIYKELEVSIDKLEVGNPAEQPLIDIWPQLADASVLVEGTVTQDGGAPETFMFTSPLDIDLELPFETPIEFATDDNPVTVVLLTIDIRGWFAGTGDVLDPTDPADRSDIEGAIQASVELHEND